jgi:hypothetical protein
MDADKTIGGTAQINALFAYCIQPDANKAIGGCAQINALFA